VQVFSMPKTSKVWQFASLLIRGRVEVLILAVAVTAYVWLRGNVTPMQVKVTVVVAVLVVFGLPWSRRFVVSRAWCVADRHRLRVCLRQTKIRTMNMDGSLPLMLWARPTKTGERIWLWIRAGSSGGDIEDALEYIAPACVARAARLHRVRQLTTIVAVEIIRRDPLAKSVISSPLAKLTARFSGRLVGEGTDPITAAPAPVVTLHPVSDAATSSASSPGKPARKSTLTAVPSGGPTVVVNGEDLSDYVD
jgi:hypothetical protein